ncbi:MAG: peptidoglycan DD-metalloendopeptidase family protein [Gemmatimonadales bacterium]
MRVSLRGIQLLAGLVGVVALAAAIFGYGVITRAVNLSQLERLERRNEFLAEELDRAQVLLASVSDTLEQIAVRDELVRLLAGLEPTDPDVQLAGVGGPAGAWSAREQVLSEAPEGLRALDLRTRLDDFIRRANLLSQSYDEAVDSLRSHTDRLERTPSISPIAAEDAWLTSGFARMRMHPIYHEVRPHEGIDVSAPEGTPILAPAGGTVRNVRTMSGYGRTVTVDHGNGVVTFYAHCSRVLVRAGQPVRRGDKIAEVGSTGIATGPHLHYEVIVNGRAVDPKNFIFPEAIVD